MIRIYASDPAYPDINRLILLLAYLHNTGVHFDMRGMPEAERLAAIKELEDLFEEMEH